MAEKLQECRGFMRSRDTYRPLGSSFGAKNLGTRSSMASLPPGLAYAQQRGVGDDKTWLAIDGEGEMMRRERDFKGQWFFSLS